MLWGLIAKAAGNVLGDISTGVGNYYEKERAIDALNQQMGAENKAYGIGSKYYTDLQNEYAPEASTYMSDVQNWRNQAGQAPIEMRQFDDSKYNVNAYLDPSIAFQQEQARKAIEQSAMARGGGMMMTGPLAKALSDRAQNIGQTFRTQAVNEMNADRQFGYNDFLNHFNSQKTNEAQRLQNLGNMMGQSGNARQNLFDARGGQAELGMGHEQALGDLLANRENTMGGYLKNQFGTLSNHFRAASNGASSSLSNMGMNGGQNSNMGGNSGNSGGGSGGGLDLNSLLALFKK